MAKQDIRVCIDANPDLDTDVFRIGAGDDILRLLADAHDTEFTNYIHTSENLSVDTLDLSDEYDHYAREHRKLDRKEHGSANWENQRRKVAQAKRTIKRKVRDYQHKLTT